MILWSKSVIDFFKIIYHKIETKIETIAGNLMQIDLSETQDIFANKVLFTETISQLIFSIAGTLWFLFLIVERYEKIKNEREKNKQEQKEREIEIKIKEYELHKLKKNTDQTK